MDKKYFGLGILFVLLIFAVVGLTNGQAQGKKKVGGGDITFKPKGANPVVLSPDFHFNPKKIK
jgi:hypothetical protein